MTRNVGLRRRRRASTVGSRGSRAAVATSAGEYQRRREHRVASDLCGIGGIIAHGVALPAVIQRHGIQEVVVLRRCSGLAMRKAGSRLRLRHLRHDCVHAARSLNSGIDLELTCVVSCTPCGGGRQTLSIWRKASMRNPLSRWCLLALLIVPLATSFACGPDVHGRLAWRGERLGRRGSRRDGHADQRGQRRAARSGLQRVRASTTSRAVPPGNYTVKAALTGFKTYENKGVRIAHAAVRHARHHARGRPAAGDHHRHRRSAAHRHVERLDRRRHRLDAARRRCRAAAVRRSSSPSRCPRWSPRATRSSTASRTRPTRRCCRSAAARAARNNYLVDGVPVTDLRNRASANPQHRGARRRQRAGAPVRRRNRPHRRRHVQRRHQVGRQRAGTAAASTRPVRTGARPTTSSRSWPACRCPTPTSTSAAAAFGGPVIKNRTFFWVVVGRLRLEHDAQRANRAADRAREGRRLLADASTAPASSW